MSRTSRKPQRPQSFSARWAAGVAAALLLLTGCATGSLATPESTPPPASSSAPAPTTAATGPTLVVTVPDLVPGGTDPAAPSTPAAAEPPPASSPAAVAEAPPMETAEQPAPAPEPAETTAVEPPAPAPAPAPEPAAPAAPAGAGLNVSLANCDGCTVLATHRNVTGELSGALVGTGSGRAILLSVAADGQVNGVIGVPYGAAFPTPDGGVLACAQSRCVVTGRQSDGRAILSAFELTSTGAWRDVSGDDAFPSATEQAAVVDLGGELAIAVQDQGNGAAVWLLYTWSGDRYSVLGCTADGAAPTAADAVSPDQCLS